jgi:transglycosylase-like protein with SLT domain
VDRARRICRILGQWFGIVLAAAALLLPSLAFAQTAPSIVRVPLTIDYAILSEALKRQIYTQNGRATLWNGANDCQYFYAENPVFSRQGAGAKLETNGSLSLGVAVGSQCVSPISWSGIIEAETAPYVSGHMLKFRVLDINLRNPQHQKTLIAGKGFDLVKQYFIPRIETFEFDLDPATDQLRELAEAASPPAVAERVKTAVSSLRVVPEIAPHDEGLGATIELTLPGFTAASPPSPAPQLTPDELAAFEKLLDQWDAFLVFAIKQLGGLNHDPQLRKEMLAILLDSRFRLVDALAHPQNAGPDPIRVLFLDSWQRLGEAIRGAALRGTLGDRSLEFLSFISAGNALFALDQAGPALGMRISADDLRRLAHIAAPQAKGDPLAFSFDEDPELRKTFGVKEPLQSEGPLDIEPGEPSTATSTAPTSTPMPPTPTPQPTPAPASPSPTLTPAAPTRTEPSAAPTPGAMPTITAVPTASITASPTPAAVSTPESTVRHPSSVLALRRWPVGAAEACAGEVPPPKLRDAASRLQELSKKLRRAVVRDDNAEEYRAELEELLELSARREMNEEDVASVHRPLYLRLAKAVAWQESCWRQFRLRRKRVMFLLSSSGDVGLMQVNKYVWRGFYSIPRLEWDILYNASAGMEILAQLLEDVAGKRDLMTPGNQDLLARSAYAAYNGGPQAYRRWRGPESREERLIDRAFWKKYQAVSHGQKIDILTCAAEWDETPGH